MSLSLQIFSPLDLGRTYFARPAREAFLASCLQHGWSRNEPGKGIELDADFLAHHPSLRRDVTARVATEASLRLQPVEGVAGVGPVELLLYSTGLALLVCTYELSTESAPVAIKAYHLLSRNHFCTLFGWVVDCWTEFFGTLPGGDSESLQRACVTGTKDPQAGSPKRPHWFHGIFLHVGRCRQELLGRDFLHGVTGVHDSQEHAFADLAVLATFGWETTAVTTTQPAEAADLAHLVKLVGYIWELHFVVDSLAARKLSSIGQESVRRALPLVREFRLCAAILLDVCDLARLTMIDRHLRMMEAMHDEWHLSRIKHTIASKAELLHLAYTQLKDELAEKRANRFNATVLFLTITSLLGIAAEVAGFLVGNDWVLSAVQRLFTVVAPVVAVSLALLVWLRWRSS
jgi:hypothetical protein